MQTLTDARITDNHAVGEPRADPAAAETTIVPYRVLVVLASRGPRRMVDLAGALQAFADAAGEVPDSEWPA